MKKVVGFLKRFFNFVFNLLATMVGADCDWQRKAVDDGIVDLSGQGKNKYGE